MSHRCLKMLSVCVCVSVPVQSVTVSMECVIKVQKVMDSVCVSRHTPGSAVTKVRPWHAGCLTRIAFIVPVHFRCLSVWCLIVHSEQLLCFVLLAVSTRCSSCSPYSYCKGEGDTADCECLPGYRKMMPQGKCGSKCTTVLSNFSVLLDPNF